MRYNKSRRAALPFPPVDMERAYTIIDALTGMAAAKTSSVAQLAIAWLLQQPRVTSVVVGAKRIDQLEDNLGAVDVRFTEAELESLDRVSQIPAEYPGWMLSLWGSARARQLAGSHT